MNKLVYRHLAEQKWRNKGALDLLVRVFFLQMTMDGSSHFMYRWNEYTRCTSSRTSYRISIHRLTFA